MTCPPNSQSCNDCSHGSDCANDTKIIDIEDYKTELKTLRARTAELESKLANLSTSAEKEDSPNDDEEKQQQRQKAKPPLRSTQWFSRTDDKGLSALYIDRYLNYGLTQSELSSPSKPIIGIANSGSDLAPCNQHHTVLSQRVREGIRSAGGVAIEFPTHPIQESARRPTATLDRNLMFLGLVEILHGYPLDGVVLLTGCDKTTPGALMAAACVDIPAICMNVGPMLNGWAPGSNREGKGEGGEQRIGSGTVLWKARELHAAGKIDDEELTDMVTRGTPSVGHCNTMGTASTMNALAEALGMALPGSAAIPAAYRERAQCAYQTGLQIVEMVQADRKPSDIMTREAFENAIVVNTAIGGSTNAPIHLAAIAKHMGVDLNLDDWDSLGYHIPLLLNVQPAGEMLCEEYFRAGGLPAILSELLSHNALPHPDIPTCNGQTLRQNTPPSKTTRDRRTIKPYLAPLKPNAGFLHLTGNIFTSALMKTSVISPSFRSAFLEDPADPNAFEAPIAVFDGPEDYHARIDTAPITARTILVMRGAGPQGYPGAAEVVNMTAPARLLKQGLAYSLPCIGDGRQSGTSGSPSILHASPEAAAGGNLAILRDGDVVRVDLGGRRVDLLVREGEIEQRRNELLDRGGYKVVESRTPWEDLFRREVGGLSEGMVFDRAVRFQRVVERWGMPRDNH